MLNASSRQWEALSLDLHVLGTPPAFILSQDQTLQKRRTLRRISLLSGKARNSANACGESRRCKLRYSFEVSTYISVRILAYA